MGEPTLERVQKSLIIFNIILAVISLICFLFSFVFNCWTFKLKYTVDGEDVKSIMKVVMPDESKPYINEVDWDKFEKQPLYLNVGVNTIDSLVAIFSDEETVVKRLIDRQITSIIEQAKPITHNLVKCLAKAVLEVTVRQIAGGHVSGEIDLTEIESVVDNYLDNKISKDKAINQMIDIIKIEVPKLIDEEVTDEKAETVRTNLDTYMTPIDQCRGSDGKLDMLSILYGKLVDADVFTNYGDMPTGDAVVTTIKTKVYNLLQDAGVVAILAIAIEILALLVLAQAVAWLLLLIFAIIRIFARRKATGLMFVRTFAWIPHVLLVGIPNALLILMREIYPQSLVNIGLEKLALSFSSITSVSAGGALIVSVIALAFYNRLKTQEKEYLEEEATDIGMIYPEMRQSLENGMPTTYDAPVEFSSDDGAPTEFTSDQSATFSEFDSQPDNTPVETNESSVSEESEESYSDNQDNDNGYADNQDSGYAEEPETDYTDNSESVDTDNNNAIDEQADNGADDAQDTDSQSDVAVFIRNDDFR